MRLMLYHNVILETSNQPSQPFLPPHLFKCSIIRLYYLFFFSSTQVVTELLHYTSKHKTKANKTAIQVLSEALAKRTESKKRYVTVDVKQTERGEKQEPGVEKLSHFAVSQ